jgi:hypothetical protein
MRPALVAKSGSRGKIQQRCCQGRMASSFSHRQRVSLREAVNPQARTCEASSATLQRERGAPSRLGNSQAMALTCTTSSGEGNPASAGAFGVFQTGQSFFEPFSPAADDFALRAEPVGDLVVQSWFDNEVYYGVSASRCFMKSVRAIPFSF